MLLCCDDTLRGTEAFSRPDVVYRVIDLMLCCQGIARLIAFICVSRLIQIFPCAIQISLIPTGLNRRKHKQTLLTNKETSMYSYSEHFSTVSFFAP